MGWSALIPVACLQMACDVGSSIVSMVISICGFTVHERLAPISMGGMLGRGLEDSTGCRGYWQVEMDIIVVLVDSLHFSSAIWASYTMLPRIRAYVRGVGEMVAIQGSWGCGMCQKHLNLMC